MSVVVVVMAVMAVIAVMVGKPATKYGYYLCLDGVEVPAKSKSCCPGWAMETVAVVAAIR